VSSTSASTVKVNRLGTDNINKLMLEFAIPAIAGLVINALYNVIDSIFLGNAVGSLGLAATTVAMPMMTAMIALGQLCGVGGNVFAAIKLGEGDKPTAEKALGNTLFLLLLMSILVALLGTVLINPILIISGATSDSMDMSRTFIQIICVGFIFQGIGMGLNNFIRTAGDPNRALYTMAAGAAVCIVLNALFVLQLRWGVAGSALATVCGEAVSAAMVLYYFTLSKKAPFKLYLCNLQPVWHMCVKILQLGTAMAVVQMLNAVITVLYNHMMSLYGAQTLAGAEGALAIIGVVMKVSMLTVFPLFGVAMAAQPLLGYNHGAHRHDRVLKTWKTAIVWASIIAIILWAIVELVPNFLVGLFGIDETLMAFAVPTLRAYLIMLPVVGFQIVTTNYFQGIGKPGTSLFLSLTRQAIFLMPAIWLCPYILPLFFPNIDIIMSVCIAAPISDGLASLVTLAFAMRERRRLRSLHDVLSA
jgi:putative MATE family efflux protein